MDASAWLWVCCAVGLLLLLLLALGLGCAWWGLDVRSMRSGCVWNGCGFMDMARCRSGSDIVAMGYQIRGVMGRSVVGSVRQLRSLLTTKANGASGEIGPKVG
jgi:hypothetical protein